ncbi:MAG: hypothetical protein U0T73_13590 [Chitinophagales bacterium]
MKLTHIIVALFLIGNFSVSGARTQTRREITFIVVRAMRVKDVAAQFHVAPKELAKINHVRKRQMVYAGKQLRIPVWLRKKAAVEKGGKSHDGFSMSDYEINRDSVEDGALDEFISMADVERDTARRIQIGKQIKQLDKQVSNAYTRLDSLENANDGVPYDPTTDTDNRTAIKKMMVARNKHAAAETIYAEIDSLGKEKAKLSAERVKVTDRINQYESLMENAEYEAHHHSSTQVKRFSLNESSDRFSSRSNR